MTRFFYSLADTLGLFTVTVLAAGCLHVHGPLHDLRPFVATCGAYAMTDAQAPPAPTPTVCKTCGGKGVLGDGRIEIPCPDCTKKQEATTCQNKTCTVP